MRFNPQKSTVGKAASDRAELCKTAAFEKTSGTAVTVAVLGLGFIIVAAYLYDQFLSG